MNARVSDRPDRLIGGLRSSAGIGASLPVRVFRAPGRVNLIGEHTDYNDGFVLPAAIERETRIAAAPRSDGIVRIASVDLGRETTFDLAGVSKSAEEPWSNYVRGVAAGLMAAGYPVRGMDAVVQGDVPIGAGLSSSAALEMALARRRGPLEGGLPRPTSRGDPLGPRTARPRAVDRLP